MLYFKPQHPIPDKILHLHKDVFKQEAFYDLLLHKNIAQSTVKLRGRSEQLKMEISRKIFKASKFEI